MFEVVLSAHHVETETEDNHLQCLRVDLDDIDDKVHMTKLIDVVLRTGGRIEIDQIAK